MLLNIKCHLKYKNLKREEKFKKTRTGIKDSFLYNKSKITVYTFNQANIINFTGIKSFSDIDNVFREYKAIRRIEYATKPKVDNTTAVLNTKLTQTLEKIKYKLNEKHLIGGNIELVSIKYNPSVFPGLTVKTKIGTCNVFNSGKIILIGCKSERLIKKLGDAIKNEI